MKVWMLGSGSGGNAVLLEADGRRVLIDAGFSPRTLSARLSAIGVPPGSIEACIVTHEHIDHVRGAAAASARWGWALHASAGTITAATELASTGCHALEAGVPVLVSTFTVEAFRTPHDAACPIGVRVTSTASGAVAAVCTDLGHASDAVRTMCARADILVIESNHDEGMLRSGPYPPSVRARIASRHGHLSNRESAEFSRECVHRDLAHVVLAHLSERCNDPSLAHDVASDRLRGSGFRGTVSVASQHQVVGPFVPRGSRTAAVAQYALAL
ncbi:MAG: MBL fold metallo-hydrolase [Gemmatimonadales bacterium]|nr:MBL fold metallo-hydrolase [Gemmatimonadales bacterium]